MYTGQLYTIIERKFILITIIVVPDIYMNEEVLTWISYLWQGQCHFLFEFLYGLLIW